MMEISDRVATVVIRLIGAVLLLIGALSVLVGPAETYVFRMFREGGQFHYEGFGFGSLMFANIAIQIAGYYVIAALCIPLGYGHLRLRWWVRPAMTTLLIDWLIVGAPLSLMAAAILFTSKSISTAGIPFVALLFLLLYPVLPSALLWFYRSPAVRSVVRAVNAPSGWLSDAPQSVRVAGSLLVLLVLVLHFPLLLGGLFPLFGRVATGLAGVLLIDLSIAVTAVLAWGVAWRYRWAWWCAIVFLGLLTVSSTVTFLTTVPREITALMPLAPREAEAVSGIPMQGYHLALFAGMIPLATLIVVVVSRRGLTRGCSPPNGEIQMARPSAGP
jgi:hypothetical protein